MKTQGMLAREGGCRGTRKGVSGSKSRFRVSEKPLAS